VVAGFEDVVVEDVLRARLSRRYGDAVGPWLDGLPVLLASLGEQWRLDFGSLLQRGNVSVVVRCETAAGVPAVLEVSPDRTRIREEAVALAGWDSGCVPAVLAVDDRVGALLLEPIEPGTPLDLSPSYPQRLGHHPW
jgi:streptomycin 6-kinase